MVFNFYDHIKFTLLIANNLNKYNRITWPEIPPMAVQYSGHEIQAETRDQYTALPLVIVLVTWFKFQSFKILHIWIFV